MRGGIDWLIVAGLGFLAANAFAAAFDLVSAIETGNPVFAVLLMFNGFVAGTLLNSLTRAR